MLKMILFCTAKFLAGGFATTCGVVVLCNEELFTSVREKVIGLILLVAGLMCLLSFII